MCHLLLVHFIYPLIKYTLGNMNFEPSAVTEPSFHWIVAFLGSLVPLSYTGFHHLFYDPATVLPTELRHTAKTSPISEMSGGGKRIFGEIHHQCSYISLRPKFSTSDG